MLKIGVNCGFFHFKVSKWIHDETQPLQCYKCLDFNHRQDQCQVPQKCFICSENHDFKQCPNKNKPKCANCLLPHAAVSKDCGVMKEKTLQKTTIEYQQNLYQNKPKVVIQRYDQKKSKWQRRFQQQFRQEQIIIANSSSFK